MVQIDNNNENFNKHLENILDIDLYKKKVVNSCPHCNSEVFVKHGKYQNKQRFLCKCCRKTFTKITNTIFYRTKKSTVIWIKFVNLMLSKKSLRECSRELDISLPTAFFWRHKFLYGLRNYKEPTILIDLIEMIKIFTKENYKGDKNAPLRKREKVWTILTHDSNESILASPISIGKWDRKSFDKIIYSRVGDDSYLNTFCDGYLHKIAKEHNKVEIKGERIISNTNLWSYVREVQNSLIRFRGVATKYLTHYLYFSSIFTTSKKYDSISLIYTLSNLSTYIMNKDFKLMEII